MFCGRLNPEQHNVSAPQCAHHVQAKKSINQTMCNSDKTTVCDLHCANAQTLILIIITLLFEQWQENGMEIKS